MSLAGYCRAGTLLLDDAGQLEAPRAERATSCANVAFSIRTIGR